jgi:hypothetical protein
MADVSIKPSTDPVILTELSCPWQWLCPLEPLSLLRYIQQHLTQLAHNVLRTVCFWELGESVVVLWLFCTQPTHNFVGMLQNSCLALEHSQHRKWPKSSNMVRLNKNVGNVVETFSNWFNMGNILKSFRERYETTWECMYFSITFPTGFLMVLFKIMFSERFENVKKQRSSVGITVLHHNVSYRFPHGST